MKRLYYLLSLIVASLFVPSVLSATEKSITLEQALSIVQSYYENNITGSEDYWLLIERPDQWEIFVDEQPLANWEHECAIFKFPNTGDVTVDMVPEIIDPEPSCPPNEYMELLSCCKFYFDVRPGFISSLNLSDFNHTHQIRVSGGELDERDFSFFYDCVNSQKLSQVHLSKVQLKNNAIPDGAFSFDAVNGGFNRLQRIILPEGVEVIGLMAFSHCNLKNIILPASIKTLGEKCFFRCEKMQWIYSKAVTPPACAGETCFDGVPKSTPIYVPVGAANAYRNAQGWSYFSTFIETDETPSAGIHDVAGLGELKVFWANGAINIQSVEEAREYFVYTLDGSLFSRGWVASNKNTCIPAPKGVYIVKIGERVVRKVM